MNLFVLVWVLVIAGCKTSGQIVTSRNQYQDPTAVKTVDNSSPNQNVADESVLREYEIVKGELENQKYKSETEKSQLENKIKELEAKNKTLSEELQKVRSGQTQPVIEVSGQIPNGKSGAPLLWELANKDLSNNQFEKALTPLTELVKNYPKDSKAFHALLALGATHYQLSHFNEAALAFNQAIDKYPKKADLAFAWFGQGVAFAQMKQSEDSKLFFEELIRRYPKANEAKIAQKILSKKEKLPSDIVKIGSARWLQQ